ncbi:MAG: serine/threonine protein kinase [Deltaproteobacteria bacterium]|nr:serine/threonine protein kinase [Deltaproteobacteria bacterium]
MIDLQPGIVIADRYRILRKIGSGGMASVYEAHDAKKKRRVALKIPYEPFWMDRRAMKRFLREARATLPIRSPHVVRTLAVGRQSDGMPYMVMQFVEGTPLRDIMYSDGKQRQLPTELALTLLHQIATGLAAAHEVQVIHRDVKPDNVLVTFLGETPVARLFDFGLSLAATEAATSRLTEPNTTLGTPQYMPPEQAQSARQADARADVYSLGIIAYELLAGSLPFEGEDAQEVWRNAWRGHAIPLGQSRPDLPAPLADEIMRAISRDPEQRHPTAAAFRAAIEPYVPASARAAPPRGAHADDSTDGLTWPLVVGATFAGVIAIGMLIILLLRWMQ